LDQTVKRPKRRYLLLPYLGLALGALLWTSFWFYARGAVEARLDAGLVAMANGGDVLSCAEREMSGYPFRIVITCQDARYEHRNPANAFALTTPELTAVAQIYNHRHVILEAASPLTLESAATRTEIAHETARASIRLEDERLARFSLDIEGGSARFSPAAGPALPPLAFQRLTAHARAAEAGTGYDLALRAMDLSWSSAETTDATTWNIIADGALQNPPPTLFRAPLASVLQQWQAGSGRLDIARAQFGNDTETFEARGALALDGTGRLEGALTVGYASGGEASAMPPALAAARDAVIAGFAMLGQPGTVGEKDGRVIDVTIASGLVQVGFLPLTTLPPVF